MSRILYIALFIILFIIIVFITQSPMTESFNNQFVQQINTQFKGINLLGSTSNDTFYATSSPYDCRDVCARNKDCTGFSFYTPGNRCYLFSSGNFVDGQPGFISGKKLE